MTKAQHRDARRKPQTEREWALYRATLACNIACDALDGKIAGVTSNTRAHHVLEDVARHMKGINLDGHTRVDGDDIACARNWEKLRAMVNDVLDIPSHTTRDYALYNIAHAIKDLAQAMGEKE